MVVVVGVDVVDGCFEVGEEGFHGFGFSGFVLAVCFVAAGVGAVLGVPSAGCEFVSAGWAIVVVGHGLIVRPVDRSV